MTTDHEITLTFSRETLWDAQEAAAEQRLPFRSAEDIRRETRQEIAANLQALGADQALISQATGLSDNDLDPQKD